ncbi:unnamed protein product [Fraxinus pennsylvanica]|uniref:Uncharacterized protein n=1 Tax=Fraxinus pennsylvanica TaxID=56036 RepID=A0AAD2AFG6_9LAMI|nr:unnamed protein product [Fraxinus pennsylvanica]
MGLKGKISRLHKGNSSIADYMREVRQIVDTLSILDKEPDLDEVTVHVLNGLDNDYKDIAAAINARDTSLTIDELQEKLEATEFQIKANLTPHQLSSPVTANYTTNKPSNHYNSRNKNSNSRSQFNTNQPSHSNSQFAPAQFSQNYRPNNYKGKCQLCQEVGHSAKFCQKWRSTPIQNNSPGAYPPRQQRQFRPFSPSAYVAAQASPSSSDWLLDSGSAHGEASSARRN